MNCILHSKECEENSVNLAILENDDEWVFAESVESLIDGEKIRLCDVCVQTPIPELRLK